MIIYGVLTYTVTVRVLRTKSYSLNTELIEFAKEVLMKCGRKAGVRDDLKSTVQATGRMEVQLTAKDTRGAYVGSEARSLTEMSWSNGPEEEGPKGLSTATGV